LRVEVGCNETIERSRTRPAESKSISNCFASTSRSADLCSLTNKFACFVRFDGLKSLHKFLKKWNPLVIVCATESWPASWRPDLSKVRTGPKSSRRKQI
jgi:3-deoxy-D-manno-octulosonic-acid transferase